MESMIKGRPKLNQGRLIASQTEADTYIMHHDVRLDCAKCGKYTYNDVYASVSGTAIATVQLIIRCRDCHTEIHKPAELMQCQQS